MIPVSTSKNCESVIGEGWSDCYIDEPGYWRAKKGTSLNASSTQFFRGSGIDVGGNAYITKCLDLSSYSKAYLKFDWSITDLDTDEYEYILIRINTTDSPSFTDLWNSGSGTIGWNNEEIDVTTHISSNTCFRVYCWRATLGSEYCDLDDFKIIGSKTIVQQYFSSGELLSSVFYSTFTPADWSLIRWTADTPAGTSLTIQTRTGKGIMTWYFIQAKKGLY